MNCPICNYAMDPLDQECPKCAAKQRRHEGAALPPQSAPQERQFDITNDVDISLLSTKPGAASPKQRPAATLPPGVVAAATTLATAKPAAKSAAVQVPKSCASYGHWRMYPLERFTEDDVNESPTIDGYGTRATRLYLIVWFLNLLGDKAKVARRRQRVRELRAEVLPRAPGTLICPGCLEFLERD